MPDAKPDLTEFYKLSKPKKPPCKIGLVLQTAGMLKVQERIDLQGALAVDTNIITPKAIIEWLDKRNTGLEFNSNNIVNHRSRKCTCANA
jgi:hypothetical protein